MPQKRHKYGVSPKEDRTVNGIVFDSKKEAKRYCELRILETSGLIQDLEIQPRYDIDVNGKHIGFWKGDFRYQEDGKTIIEDVKGMRTAIYRLKKKLVEAIHGIVITEI